MTAMRFDRRGFLVGALSAGALNAAAGKLRGQEGGSAPTTSSRADWLIDPSSYLAKVTHSADGRQVTIENGLVRRVFLTIPEHELRDDLVGTREIDHADMREIDHGEGPLVDLAEEAFDLAAHRGARWPGDQIGVEVARDRLAEHGAEVNVMRHFAASCATRSGMIT